ncbi:MAG: hypothetical protein LQ341_004986 [Variospora aurantia]|nr:MAG: hypothetical protein LQ341_004986 [Variospora aurantia]
MMAVLCTTIEPYSSMLPLEVHTLQTQWQYFLYWTSAFLALSIVSWRQSSRITQILYMFVLPLELQLKEEDQINDHSHPMCMLESDAGKPQMAAAFGSGAYPIAELDSGAYPTMELNELGFGTTATVLDPKLLDRSGAYFNSAIASPLSQKGGRRPAEEADRVPGDDEVGDMMPSWHNLGKRNDKSLIDFQIKMTGQDIWARTRQDHPQVHSKKDGLPERRSSPDPSLRSSLLSALPSSQPRLFGQPFNPRVSWPRPSGNPAPKLTRVRSSSILTKKPLANHGPDPQTRRKPRKLIDLSPRSSDLIDFSESLSEPRTPMGSRNPYEPSDLMQFSELSGPGTSGTIVGRLPGLHFSDFHMSGLSNRKLQRVSGKGYLCVWELMGPQSSGGPSPSISFDDDTVLPGDSISEAGRVRFLSLGPTVSETAQHSGQSRGTIAAQTAPRSLPAITSTATPHQTVNARPSPGSNEAHPLPQSTPARSRFQGKAGENLRKSLCLMAEGSGPEIQSHPQSTSAHSGPRNVTAAASPGADHWALDPKAPYRPQSAAARSSKQDATAATSPWVEQRALEPEIQYRPQSTSAHSGPQNVTAATLPGAEHWALDPEARGRPQSAAARSSVRGVDRTIQQGSLRSSLESEPEYRSRPQSAGAQSSWGSGLLENHTRPQSTSAYSATGSDFQSVAGAYSHEPPHSSLQSVHGNPSLSPTIFSANSAVAIRRTDPLRDIRAVLEGWCDEGYIPLNWAEFVSFNAEDTRIQVEVDNQIRSFEYYCRKRIHLKLFHFQIYGTPDKFAYDVLKCWVLFGQHMRYRASTFPLGYTPVHGEFDDLQTESSEFTLY